MTDIWAATAFLDTGFAVSIGQLEDDPQSSLLCICSSVKEQKWQSTQIAHTIVALNALQPGDPGQYVTGLGIDGDLIFDTQPPSKHNIFEEIDPDFDSVEMEGLGSMSDISAYENGLLVCGYNSQVYQRLSGGNWSDIWTSSHAEQSFEAVAGNAQNGLAVCGFSGALFRTPTQSEQEELDRILENGTMREYSAATEKYEYLLAPPGGCLFVKNRDVWNLIELPGSGYLNDVVSLPNDKFLAAGGGGIIVAGTNINDFQDVSESNFNETFHSATIWNGKCCLLADSCLKVLDEDYTVLKTIALPRGLSSPHTLVAASDRLWYFDHRGVAFFRQDEWHQVSIPSEYWEHDT